MAYAAVLSVKQTINGLLNSNSLVSSSTRQILEFAYNEATSLQKVLERFDDSSRRCSERLYGLEGQIRDGAHQLEDALEIHELNDESYVRQEISGFAEAVKKMEVEYIEELSKPAVGAATSASSPIDFGVEMVMVGHSTELESIRNLLLRRMRPDDMWFFSILGEVGSGRTAVAKAYFEDRRKDEEQFFECGAWVTVGSNDQVEDVLIRVLAFLDLQGHYEKLIGREKKIICSYLNTILESRRCLIVLDDVRDVELIHCLRSSCSDHSNGSLLLFTTSSDGVSQVADATYQYHNVKHFFEEIISQFVLKKVIFGGESVSPELVECGYKILDYCPNGSISIARILLFLYETKNSPEQWSKIAADKENPIFMVEDEISEMRKIKRKIQSFRDDGQHVDIARLVELTVDTTYNVNCISMMVQPERFFRKMQIVSLLGMAGIGKTACIIQIFKDESFNHFDYRVWVNLGPNYQPEDILIDILAQIYPSIDKMLMKGDEELARGLCAQLACKRCLIVLDDLWSKEPLIRLKYAFPDIMGTILVTTRLAKVATFGSDDTCYKMNLLDKEESWCLLRENVFAQGLCPPELEKFGRKIAEKCEGLPLLILTVADQLLKVEMSVECWNNVASGKLKSVFMNAHHKISKALLPSYERLPQHLKACFLYIGVFCNGYEIPTTKLTHLWIVERFLEPNASQILEDILTEYLSVLVDDSLVMAQRKVSDLQIKTCRLHPVFWHLSNSVAVRIKLFYGMNSYGDCSIEVLKSQRRLCIRNSILLGIKDVYNAMKSSSKSRALLCTGAPHQYPVPLYFGSRFLRVLDAVAIRFYEFPVEVVELFHLRYLGLTCNGELPTSISKLWKLQYLIVNRYINTRSLENCSPLPVEIWDMKELKHLQVMGGVLPNPKCGDGLPNLSTLLDVSAQSCTKKVLKRIPNLKRLSIQIELAPDETEKGNESFHCLNRISRLRGLESLKCVVRNPHFKFDGVAPPAPISMFPSSLKELSLSGLGYPWEYMSTIGKLKNLKVLKLKRYAFRGPKWDNKDEDDAFCKLKYLLVEDTNLVQWEGNLSTFCDLERLSIRHCYKLQLLPTVFDFFKFPNLEIVDCSPLTVSWAEKVKELVEAVGNCEIKVHLSWMGEK